MIKIEHQVFNWGINNLRLLHSKIYSDNLVKYFSSILLYQFSDNIKIDLQEKYNIDNVKIFIKNQNFDISIANTDLLITKLHSYILSWMWRDEIDKDKLYEAFLTPLKTKFLEHSFLLEKVSYNLLIDFIYNEKIKLLRFVDKKKYLYPHIDFSGQLYNWQFVILRAKLNWYNGSYYKYYSFNISNYKIDEFIKSGYINDEFLLKWWKELGITKPVIWFKYKDIRIYELLSDKSFINEKFLTKEYNQLIEYVKDYIRKQNDKKIVFHSSKLYNNKYIFFRVDVDIRNCRIYKVSIFDKKIEVFEEKLDLDKRTFKDIENWVLDKRFKNEISWIK